MSSEEQRDQNPDVNSYNPDVDPGEDSGTGDGSDENDDNGSIPVPPDATPPVAIEEPPGTEGPPVGDVDDSPKRIA